MFETTRYEMGRRVRGTTILAAALSLYVAFIVWYFTVLEGVDYDQMLESMPPAMMDAFGIETLATIEGFLGSQIYNFLWLLGLGLYFAYAGGGLIANDIERDRLELLISFPRSRSQLLFEKAAALALPLVGLNVVVSAVTYLLVVLIGESIDPMHLLLVHALSIPYLLVCAGIGLVCSVVVDRAAIAERAAIGIVFVLFLVESVVGGAAEFEWIQYLSPTHYYEPTPILIDGSYALADTGVLLAAFLVLLVASQRHFRRRDL